MGKLFEIQVTAYVVADSEDEAVDKVKYGGVLDMDASDVDAYETNSVLAHWFDCIPFGADDDKTCKEYLSDFGG